MDRNHRGHAAAWDVARLIGAPAEPARSIRYSCGAQDEVSKFLGGLAVTSWDDKRNIATQTDSAAIYGVNCPREADGR